MQKSVVLGIVNGMLTVDGKLLVKATESAYQDMVSAFTSEDFLVLKSSSVDEFFLADDWTRWGPDYSVPGEKEGEGY